MEYQSHESECTRESGEVLLYWRHLVTSSGSVPAWDCISRSQASSPDQNNPRRSFGTSENAVNIEINTIIHV